MILVVVFFGVVMIAFSAFAVVRPAFLRRAVEYWVTPRRLYVAVLVRVALGIVLIAVAPDARLPTLVRALGVLTIAVGMMIPLLGMGRVRAWAAWWLEQPDLVLRVWAVTAAALGAVMIYAVT